MPNPPETPPRSSRSDNYVLRPPISYTSVVPFGGVQISEWKGKKINRADTLCNEYLIGSRQERQRISVAASVGRAQTIWKSAPRPKTKYSAKIETKFDKPLGLYANALTNKEPGSIIDRNALGQPVRISDRDIPGQQFVLQYDASGRTVGKAAPRVVRMPLNRMSEGPVFDIEGNYPKEMSLVRINDKRKNSIESACWSILEVKNKFGKYVIRLHLNEFKNSNGKWCADCLKEKIKEPLAKLAGWMKSDAQNPPYQHITVEDIDRSFKWLGSYEFEGLKNVTFRGIWFGSVTLEDCSGVTFDGCSFSGPFALKGSCRNIQVQNCEFIMSNRKKYCVEFHKSNSTTALFAFNRFNTSGNLFWTNHDWSLKERVGMFNNVLVSNLTNPKSISNLVYRTKDCYGINLYEASNYYFSESSLKRSHKLSPYNGRPLNLNWASHWNAATDAVRGKGLAGIPGKFSQQAPVLWDRNGALRDPKHPTPGPCEYSERDVLNNTQQVHTRYVYDGRQVAQREVYPPADNGGQSKTADVTRFVRTMPGGPQLFSDSDGTVDVQMTDAFGRPWYMYRAREGYSTTRFLKADKANSNTSPKPKLLFRASRFNGRLFRSRIGLSYLRGTGLLRPLPMPRWPYIGYMPWYQRVIESDYLTGRLGVMGSNGGSVDRGLLLYPDLGFWESLGVWWDNLDWSDWRTVAVVAGGAVLIIGGIALSAFTAGGSLAVTGAIIGAAVTGAGFGAAGYGLQVASTGEDFSWGKLGLNVGANALAGAVGGGVFSQLARAGGVAGRVVTLGRTALNTGLSGAAAGGTRGLIMGGGTALIDRQGAGAFFKGAGIGALVGGGLGFVGGLVGGASLYRFGAGFLGSAVSGAAGGGAAGALGGGIHAAWRGDNILGGAISGGLRGAAAGASMAMFAWSLGRATNWVRPLPQQPEGLDPRSSRQGRLLVRTGRPDDVSYGDVDMVRGFRRHHVKYLSLGGRDVRSNIELMPARIHNQYHPTTEVRRSPYGTVFY